MTLEEELYKQEQKITDDLNFSKFKQILEHEFTLDGIESFWAILQVKDVEHESIMTRLRQRLGEMDKGDADWIYDTWAKVSNLD
ncbi:MAG: hypothetical protein CMC82_01810 [Flavobacteriaceae bacterium]|nr:hypothetical protein [Flavobacteriaceae bacterium]|tara:strand:+ start:1331 stop:1582 length:252 start_codon:yes stop_codon:yes gene_type:complete